MTSAVDKEPFELFLQFSRSEFGDNAFVIPEKTLQYQRTDIDGGKVSTATFAWDGKNIKNGLAELQKENPKKSFFVALGDDLRRFLRDCRVDASLDDAHETTRPIRITIRSAAAELYVLPWELTRLEDANKDLAQVPDCTIRYTWPTTSKRAIVNDGEPRPEGGRILFAWSHGDDDAVPWNSHLNAIESACVALGGDVGGDKKQRRDFFQRDIDMVPHATFKEIHDKIAQAAQEGRPYSIVHLLCHGGMLQGGDGVGLVLTDDDDRKRGLSADGRQVNDVTDLNKVTISPDTLTTLFDGADKQEPRLVVLCACLGSAMVPGSHLGSVALAIHRTGIESVLSSRFLLSKPGSTLLAEALYGALLGRSDSPPTSLENAVRIARGRLRVENSATSDYAAIQLFQNTTGWDTRPVVFRPYRGLLTFGLEHQRYFFGRDAEIKETVEDLRALMQGSVDTSGHPRPRFLIVAAASGTGKSSMVFAGALPKLIKTHQFEWATMRPVVNPMAALDAVLGTRMDSAKPFLVIVDQFEEVFTQIDKPEQRTEFVRALWQQASGDSGISVIVTLRVDFLGRCKEIVLDEKTGLRLERVVYDEAHRVFVGQMERAALEEIVQKPADLVGIVFDDGLVAQMLTDAGLEPGALPLVEYTLDQLWEKRERKNGREGLTWETYKTLRGVTGALTKKADSILASFDEMGKRAARRLLVQLVDMREVAALDTRRRVRKDELFRGPGVDEKIFGDVLETLTRERLVVVGKDDAAITTVDFVEIAHEQLVRSWGTLRGWLNEDRQRVLECAPLEEWVKTARQSKAFVLQGDLLAQARGLREKYRDELGGEAITLIEGSEEAEARKKRLQRLGAIAIAVTEVVMAGLAVVAWVQRDAAQVAQKEASDQTVEATKQRDAARVAQEDAQRASRMAAARELLASGKPTLAAMVLVVVAPEKARGWQELAFDLVAQGLTTSTLHHEGSAYSAAWNPDGKRIVTASDDQLARVWNADGTGAPLVLTGHVGPVTSAAWSPDGQRIVTASADKTARVWNADGTGEPLVLTGHEGSVVSAVWSPDGQRVVTASWDKTAIVWKTDSSGHSVVLKGHERVVWSAAWSPDGKRIVTASADNTARVWNTDGSGETVVLKGHDDVVKSAKWSPDGKRIVTASADKTARLWNSDGSGESIILKGHESSVSSAAWSPDGKRIATASWDTTARVWNADGTGESVVLKGHEHWVVSAVWSPKGERIVTASSDKTARVWSANSSGENVVLKGHEGWVISAAWSPDGKRIVTASDDKTTRVWKTDGTGESIILRGHERDVSCAAWSPDGKRIVTASGDSTARVWNADGSGESVILKGHKYCVNSASWSPDGKRIVTTSNDGTARVWNADGSGETVVLNGHFSSAAWSPDGKRIVTASQDKTPRVWNADGTGESVILKGHEGVVYSAAWSPDGKRIVTASFDNTARVWNADGSGEGVVLKGHTNLVHSAVWSPDGTRIVTASRDHTARVWLVDIPLLQQALRNATTDCLTPAQRQTYLLESESDARKAYAECETKNGRTPGDPKK